MQRSLGIVFIVLVWATGWLFAQSSGLSLQKLFDVQVITSSNFLENIDDSPNVMYVLTKKELRQRGLRNLKDVFEVIPGFGVHHRDIQFVGQVRGIAPNDNEKIALMINSQLINQLTEPEIFQSGAFPLEIAEQIEIIVGPGGVFYGGETLTAIVNIISKVDDGNGVAVEIGEENTKALTFSMSKSLEDDVNFFASASYYEEEGFDAWRPNSANPRNARLAEMESLTGKVQPSFMLFSGFNFENWQAQFFSQNSSQPDLHLHGGEKADDGRRFDYLYLGRLKTQKDLTYDLSSSLILTAGLKRYVRSIVNVGKGDGLNPNWDLQETEYAMENALQIFIGEHYLQVGLQNKVIQHRHNYDFQWNPERPYDFKDAQGNRADYMREIVRSEDTYSTGVYLSDHYYLNDCISLIGAIRFDRNSVLDEEGAKYFDWEKVYLSPRAAVVTKPFEEMTFKLMYNRATRLSQSAQGTSLNELWGVDQKGYAPDWASANPHISKPEVLDTYESQMIYSLSDVRFSLNYWHQELQDFTSWFSPHTNVGNFSGDGLEYEIKYFLSDEFTLWTNGAFLLNNKFTVTAETEKETTDNQEEVAEFQLPANDVGEVMAVAKYTANLGLQYAYAAGIGEWSVAPTLRYFTGQTMAEPVSDIEGRSVENFGKANHRSYLDLALHWENVVNSPLSARFLVKNLFDNTELVGTQWLVDSYKPRGRTFYLNLYYDFN